MLPANTLPYFEIVWLEIESKDGDMAIGYEDAAYKAAQRADRPTRDRTVLSLAVPLNFPMG
jgi:hypothetical protein